MAKMSHWYVAIAVMTLVMSSTQSQSDETKPVPESEVPVFPKFTLRNFGAVKRLLKNLVDENKEDGVTTFNAGFLRMAFHDCWGGCDGCIDFDNGGNAGIQKYFGPLFELWNNGTIGSTTLKRKMSFADLVAAAGIVAIEYATSFEPGCEDGSCMPRIPYKVGRVDCPNRESPPNRKNFFFPGPHNHNAPLLGAEFNLTIEEHTAILGAHTIGKMIKKNSAFEGQWTKDNHVFNNEYYKNLLDSSLQYHQEKNGAGHMFWATNDKPVMMLGDDAALAHNIVVTPKSKGSAECHLFEPKDGKPKCNPSAERTVVQRFAQDNQEFYRVFAQAFDKVIHNTKGVQLYHMGVEPPAGRNVLPIAGSQSKITSTPNKANQADIVRRQQAKAERKRRKEERQARRQGIRPSTTQNTTTTTTTIASTVRTSEPRLVRTFNHGTVLHLMKKRHAQVLKDHFKQLMMSSDKTRLRMVNPWSSSIQTAAEETNNEQVDLEVISDDIESTTGYPMTTTTESENEQIDNTSMKTNMHTDQSDIGVKTSADHGSIAYTSGDHRVVKRATLKKIAGKIKSNQVTYAPTITGYSTTPLYITPKPRNNRAKRPRTTYRTTKSPITYTPSTTDYISSSTTSPWYTTAKSRRNRARRPNTTRRHTTRRVTTYTPSTTDYTSSTTTPWYSSSTTTPWYSSSSSTTTPWYSSSTTTPWYSSSTTTPWYTTARSRNNKGRRPKTTKSQSKDDITYTPTTSYTSSTSSTSTTPYTTTANLQGYPHGTNLHSRSKRSTSYVASALRHLLKRYQPKAKIYKPTTKAAAVTYTPTTDYTSSSTTTPGYSSSSTTTPGYSSSSTTTPGYSSSSTTTPWYTTARSRNNRGRRPKTAARQTTKVASTYTPSTTDYTSSTTEYTSSTTEYTSSTTEYTSSTTTPWYTTARSQHNRGRSPRTTRKNRKSSVTYTPTTAYTSTSSTSSTTTAYTTQNVPGYKDGTVLIGRNKRSADIATDGELSRVKRHQIKTIKLKTEPPATYTPPTTEYLSSTTTPWYSSSTTTPQYTSSTTTLWYSSSTTTPQYTSSTTTPWYTTARSRNNRGRRPKTTTRRSTTKEVTYTPTTSYTSTTPTTSYTSTTPTTSYTSTTPTTSSTSTPYTSSTTAAGYAHGSILIGRNR